jgi:glutamate-5-semialdehyde dehydrogenase
MSVRELALSAKKAGSLVAQLEPSRRASLLRAIADALADPAVCDGVLAANRLDVEDAERACARGELSDALIQRLVLDPVKLDGLAAGMRQLAAGDELVNRVQLVRELDKDLVLRRVSCPLGLLGVVFESRPDAAVQIAGLALKSGNALLLKGGREANRSNRAVVERLREVLTAHGLDPAAITLLEDRSQVAEMLELEGIVDLIVARGSADFVRHIQRNTSIAVLGHAEGLCHLYVHEAADPQKAARIAVDAKCSYPAACNAIETLLWDCTATSALDACVAALRGAGVELRACERTRVRHPSLAPATAQDWSTEYGDLTLAIRQVDDIDAALEHIGRYGSGHTEAIVTERDSAAERFIAGVDAAGVFHNASTRFADGYRYGLGAEVGIGTGKLHARGPVGVEGLLTYRWLLKGDGHVSSDYGPGKRSFTHRERVS